MGQKFLSAKILKSNILGVLIAIVIEDILLLTTGIANRTEVLVLKLVFSADHAIDLTRVMISRHANSFLKTILEVLKSLFKMKTWIMMKTSTIPL